MKSFSFLNVRNFRVFLLKYEEMEQYIYFFIIFYLSPKTCEKIMSKQFKRILLTKGLGKNRLYNTGYNTFKKNEKCYLIPKPLNCNDFKINI